MSTIIKIFDTTLRDGEQSPGASMNTAEKIEIARQLVRLGVDVIEAGFPISSPGDFESVRKIGDEVGEAAVVCGLSRAVAKDIDVAADALKTAKRPLIHTGIGVSESHLKHKLKISRDEAIERAVTAVKLARSFVGDVEFYAEDAGRAEPAFLYRMVESVVKAGATVVNIPDTTGYTYPEEYGALIKGIRENVPGIEKVTISVHCHNDLGMATANALAGVKNGAGQVECTVNGIGERAGNASLEEVVMGLRAFYGIATNVDSAKLTRASKTVSRLTGIPVQPNKAIVGDNAFAHESGIHVHGLLGDHSTYEAMAPALVGKERTIVMGKHTGAHSVESRLKAYGFALSRERVADVTARVKRLAEEGKQVDDAELVALAYDAEGRSGDGARSVSLEEFTAVTGFHFTPMATISLLVNGEKRRTSETGVGPIDAALKAIRTAVSQSIRLDEFRLDAVTGGADSLCQVTVRLSDPVPVPVSALGRAVGPDIVTTSVDAAIEALNRLLRAQAQMPRKPGA